MKFRFYTVDVFTDQVFGGNPLAVFPEADGLNDRQMQMIAREFNLSETVFVHGSSRRDCMNQLRIFTPQTELPFAGHPTIGAAFLLASIGALYLESDETHVVFEEAIGLVPVRLRAKDGKPSFTQLTTAIKPEVGPTGPSIEKLAKVLSLREEDFIATNGAVQAISCGLPFLIIPLRDRHAVARIRLNKSAWQQVLADFWAPNLYVFSQDAMLPSSHFHARMFAPALGVEEDPATGSAASALAVYLAMRETSLHGHWKWIVEQGFEMSRPSFIEIQVEKVEGEVQAIRVGGRSVRVAEGVMEVPMMEGGFVC